MIRWGLCCQFVDAPFVKFRSATHRYVSGLAAAEGRAYLAQIARDNADALVRAVELCAVLGVGAFRINSQILPLATHPVTGYTLGTLDEAADLAAEFAAVRPAAEAYGVRLSFHPDQFVVLNSERERVRDASVRELEFQAQVAELVGADLLTLHVGGATGGTGPALDRLARALDRLSPRARARVGFENDDRLFSPEVLLPFCRAHGLPFVYDSHHHRCHADALSVDDATLAAVETWAGRDASTGFAAREPYFHVSSPRDGWGARNPRPHADYVAPDDVPRLWTQLDVTVDVEAKAKERAVVAIAAAIRGEPAALLFSEEEETPNAVLGGSPNGAVGGELPSGDLPNGDLPNAGSPRAAVGAAGGPPDRAGRPGLTPRAPARPGAAADAVAALPPGVRLRAAWAAARARNALRRWGLIASVGMVALLGTLAALVVVPREAIRIARQAAPRPGEKVDTTGLAAAVAEAQAALRTAEGAVAAKRAAAAHANAVAAAARARAAAAALAVHSAGGRDSARAAIAELTRLLDRARTTPLPSSYRALADVPGLRGDARVRALVDSLDDVEREREAFGVGGVDPVYVALTNRATQLGRAVEAIADRRRAALQAELAATAAPTGATAGGDSGGQRLTAPVLPASVPAADSAHPTGAAAAPAIAPAPRIPLVVADTAAEAARRVAVGVELARRQSELAAARARNQAVDRRVAIARARADFETPPLAVAGAAAVLAAVLGFFAALVGEIRRPRVADVEEAERVTRARVLAVVRTRGGTTPDRARREADERRGEAQAAPRAARAERSAAVPALIDPAVEGFRVLYLSLTPTGATLLSRLAVTAAEPEIAAAVALNLAAAAAEDGRSTLVVDAELGAAALSAAAGVRDRVGLVDVVRTGFPPRESVVPVTVGRDVAVDVLPAGLTAVVRGARAPQVPNDGGEDDPRAALARLARGYDVTITSVPPAGAPGRGDEGSEARAAADVRAGAEAAARATLARDVVVCARAGHTPLAQLPREIARLNALGARVRGLVIWDDELPAVRAG